MRTLSAVLFPGERTDRAAVVAQDLGVLDAAAQVRAAEEAVARDGHGRLAHVQLARGRVLRPRRHPPQGLALRRHHEPARPGEGAPPAAGGRVLPRGLVRRRRRGRGLRQPLATVQRETTAQTLDQRHQQ